MCPGNPSAVLRGDRSTSVDCQRDPLWTYCSLTYGSGRSARRSALTKISCAVSCIIARPPLATRARAQRRASGRGSGGLRSWLRQVRQGRKNRKSERNVACTAAMRMTRAAAISTLRARYSIQILAVVSKQQSAAEVRASHHAVRWTASLGRQFVTITTVQFPQVPVPRRPEESDPASTRFHLLQLVRRMTGSYPPEPLGFGAHRGIKMLATISGEAWLLVEGLEEALLMRAGDCLLLPGGRRFQVASP